MHASPPFLFIFSCLYIFPNILFAQAKGELCMNIIPGNVFVKIGGEHIDLSKKQLPYCLDLRPGKYEAEIWASGFAVHKKTVEIKEGETARLNMGLNELSPEYEVYKKELTEYHNEKIKRNLALGAVASASLGMTIFTLSNIDDGRVERFAESVDAARLTYASAITAEELLEAESNFEKFRADYDREREKYKNRLMIGMPVTIASYALTYWVIKKQKKSKPIKPIFQEINPLLGFSKNTGKNKGIAAAQFGFTLKF